jgi:uncharacterized Zn finger protein (UPF0148 family)
MTGFKCPICGEDSFAYKEGELCPDCFDESENILLKHGLEVKDESKKKIPKKISLKD